MQATLATERQDWQTKATLYGNGVNDAEAQALVLFRHSQLPEADRPSLSDWLANGAKEDKFLAPVFRGSQQGQQASSSPAQGSAAPAPQTPQKAPHSPPKPVAENGGGPAKWTPEMVQNADIKDKRANLASMLRDLGY